MTISAIGGSATFVKTLKSEGLTDQKAQLVEKDLEASVKEAAGSSGTKPSAKAVRDALNQHIAADVASGKLSKDDAAAINKALDDMDQKASGAAAKAGGSAGAKAPPAGGGGGAPAGGGSSTKTELSRTVTISGALKTTTIKYTDGTTDTETTVNTGSDDGTSTDKASSDANVVAYLGGIAPGTLVDAQA